MSDKDEARRAAKAAYEAQRLAALQVRTLETLARLDGADWEVRQAAASGVSSPV